MPKNYAAAVRREIRSSLYSPASGRADRNGDFRMMIFNDRKRYLAFQFGRQSGLRATDEVVEQLEEQVRDLTKKCAQKDFNFAQVQNEKGLVLRELAEARIEIANLRLELTKRDREEAFNRFDDPSATRQ